MRIAYISYEYPPDTAFGGIATYVYQIAQLMNHRGHDVEVFCASTDRNVTEEINGIKVHRLLCTNRAVFCEKILPLFEASNHLARFDVMESPEFSADGITIKAKFHELPLVVKLHTPWFLIGEINNTYLTWWMKTKFIISGIIRGKRYKPFWNSREITSDPDYLITKLADQIHTPSISLGDIVSSKWDIPRNTILNVPYPYEPSDRLLSIQADTDFGVVTYVGRLEIRKGLVELSSAINLVLKKRPNIKFRFVGKVQDSPKKGLNMKSYLLNDLKGHENSLEFLEVTSGNIARIYAETDICVFPSIWENFPNTCLEAMSAARGIVASKNGGMKDMLEDCNGGILVNPFNPAEIADALIYLIDNKDARMQKGKNAREKVLSSYNNQTIGALVEHKYQELITS